MKNRNFRQTLFLISMSLILGYVFPSYSQIVILDSLINNAESIVIGNVKKIESKIEEGNNIWTYVTLDCKEFLKGEIDTSITIKIAGGEVGSLGQFVSGTPKYLVGEETLNFLGRDTKGNYFVVGWIFGKYTNKNGYWIQNNIVKSENFIKEIKSKVFSD
jgi:hypothetical protein